MSLLNEYAISPEWRTMIPSPPVSLLDQDQDEPTEPPVFVSLDEVMDGSANGILSEMFDSDSSGIREALQEVLNLILANRAHQFDIVFSDSRVTIRVD